MVVVYGIAVLIGGLGLVGWVVWDAMAGAANAHRPGPTQRFGAAGRTTVTAVLGFGLGGMSSSFAGWHPAVAVGAALAGAAFLTLGSRLLLDDAA